MRYNEQINLKLYTYTNNAFTLQAIIDDYQEISFSHNLYEAGDFTITINYNIPNALKFERGMFIQFGNDPYMFGEILTISDSIGDDGKGSQQRTITGKDARYIFKRRIIKNLNNEENWAMTDKGEICLRELVKSQCGAGAEAKRQLPVVNTIPSSAEALGKEYSVAEAFSNLYDTLVTIATQSEIGWRIKFEGTLTLEVFEGADLSNQVQFSTDYDSLANGEFTDSAESYANTVYVAGKGTGADRDIYEGEQEIQGASPSGLDRYEAYDNQSSMTSESEYEAEALSMLTQYGQTIKVSGQGLAKCPYEFQKQYNIGDTITLAFSGKSAKAQILSVVEHWVFGQYGIEFSFGKPINDFDRQMQLILKQIQKASNKTTTTSSVKWFTIPTDTSMPKADVIYDTIGFQGDVGNNGATFQLYWDSEKTGAKTYHIWLKQLAGTGKLTLTTGVSGASNLVMNAGTYVAIIYVDAEGNVTSQGATPTTTIASGNTQPVQSGALADYQPPISKTAIALDNYVTCSTGGSASTKIVTLEGFVLTYGARFNMYLQNSNTSVSALYLNVNDTGAKQIRLNGVTTSTKIYDMKAGMYECFYDGSVWNVNFISSGYTNTTNYYTFYAGDYRDYVLVADITTWYNSNSPSETQDVVFDGILTAYRAGVSVGDTAMITMYVSYYRKYNNPDGLFNKQTSIIHCKSNAKYFSASVIKYNDKIYLAIKRNSIQATNYKFAGMVIGNQPLFTALDTRTETIEELFVSSEPPLPPSTDGTYNLQCSIASGLPTYSWGSRDYQLVLDLLVHTSNVNFTVHTTDTGQVTIGTYTPQRDISCYFIYWQDNVLTRDTRNTPMYTVDGTNTYQSASENFNLSRGVKVWKINLTANKTYTFQLWCHSPSVDCNFSNFRLLPDLT